jgi:succinate dehydrogenase / fumarate reductase cytochrome b subunit
MLIFQGSESFNHYADFLHTMLHGWGIWLFRLTMVGALVVHIIATVQLVAANRASRPSRYQHDATMVASKPSRTMIWSGLTILVFFVFHILHYTVRTDGDLKLLADYHQNWAMTILGFQNALVVIFYVIAMGLLMAHVSHGVGSIFQTLGFRSKKSAGLISIISKAYAIVLFVGFSAIPISVCFFGLGKDEAVKTQKAVRALSAAGISIHDLPEEVQHANFSKIPDQAIKMFKLMSTMEKSSH